LVAGNSVVAKRRTARDQLAEEPALRVLAGEASPQPAAAISLKAEA
jgi:hypothetical protein